MRQSLSNGSNYQIISIARLTKRFGRICALDGLDLTVGENEIHGFLGPNGAGKTTTIRAILGQLRPTSGSVSVFGLHPRRDAKSIHSQLAYVPGDTVLWPNLTGGECIDLLGRLQGSLDTRRRDELIDIFELDPRKRTRSYSKGNRQKVALITALSTRASLFLLDEPTSGLDPLMASRFIDVVKDIHSQGATILLSSHIMSEVEALCERVTIIRAGQVVSTGSIADLRKSSRVSITGQHMDGTPIDMTMPASDVNEALAQLLLQEPLNLSVQPASLDEIFLANWQEKK